MGALTLAQIIEILLKGGDFLNSCWVCYVYVLVYSKASCLKNL